jgi:hypothetical protein
MMRPMSRFLIRNGLGFKEFAEIAKESLVETASQDYGIRGRKTNVSRTAVLTGLTRKEVTRIRRALREQEASDQIPIGRPAKVLDAWHNMKGFQASDGSPIDLPFDDGDPSFCTLVRTAGGDIPPRAMLKELVQSGAVITLPGERFRVVSKTFIPDIADPESIKAAGQAVFDLMSTLNNNLFVESSQEALLERRVFGDGFSQQDARKFRRLATIEGEKLLEMLNDWITTQESVRKQPFEESEGIRLGLGIFLFEEDRG